MDTNREKPLTVDEAAAELDVSARTVKRWLDRGKLDGVKIGRKWSIPQASIRAALHGVAASELGATPRDYYWVRWSYERLCNTQVHITFGGLYRVGNRFMAVCSEGPNGAAIDGGTLAAWLAGNKALGAPLQIADVVPETAELVEERTLDELWLLSGEPLTVADLETLVMIRAPRGIALDGVHDNPPEQKLVVRVTSPLTTEHKEALTSIVREVAPWFKTEVQVVAPGPRPARLPKPPGHSLRLLPSRRLNNISSRLRDAWESDEDYWVARRRSLSTLTDPSEVLPAKFADDASRCLLNSSVFPPRNIRNFLCQYRVVTLTAPLVQATDDFWAGLNVDPPELDELVRMGRVDFIAPQSIDRYRSDLLSRWLEVRPDSVLFSRRLAGATMAEGRRRCPLLYAPVDARGRVEILQSLALARDAVREPILRDALDELLVHLRLVFEQSEYRLQFQGAMATLLLGLGQLLGALLKRWRGLDLSIEATAAASHVEWATAIGADAVPIDIPGGYSDEGLTQLCVGAYGPLPLAPGARFADVENVVSGVLCLDDDCDVIALAEGIDGHAVDRMRDIARRIAEAGAGSEELEAEIQRFNREVRRFRKSKGRLTSARVFSFAGWAAAGAIGAIAGPAELAALTPAALLLNLLWSATPSKFSHPRFAALAEATQSLATRSPRDAVFVSGLRDDVAK